MKVCNSLIFYLDILCMGSVDIFENFCALFVTLFTCFFCQKFTLIPKFSCFISITCLATGGVCSMYGLSRRIWQKLITPTKPFEAGTTRYLTEAFHQIGVAAGQLQKSKQSNAKRQSIKKRQIFLSTSVQCSSSIKTLFEYYCARAELFG